MSANSDEKLEAMLRSRQVEAPSADLAQRIILKSASLPQVQNLSLWQSVRQLFAEFHLPKPGYVLASALVIGMLAGFDFTPDNGPARETSSATTQDFLSGDEALL